MSSLHDKSLGQKHGTNPRNESSRLDNGITNPPNRPPARRVDETNNDAVVSQGNDMVTEVTILGWGSSALRGGRRFRRQHREPDPPAEVAQAARVLRRKNPKMPEQPRSCRVCSVKFYCWRELFAHIRTHPEKESRCMREIFPPLNSPVEGEAPGHGSGVDGRKLASTSLHMSPRANKVHGDRNPASSTAVSPGRDVAAASQGVGTSGLAARASPPRQGLGFDFDLNKPPPKEENDDNDTDDGLDLNKLSPGVGKRGEQ